MSETIREFRQKIKSALSRFSESRQWFPAAVIAAVGVSAFGLGRISAGEDPLSLRFPAESSVVSASARIPETPERKGGAPAVSADRDAVESLSASPSGEEKYVASKKGKKYHLPWCSGAARIAEENKIWFSSKKEAEAAGYTPAANCKGI